ncbi:carbonic anhydrase [Calothrix sp. NIES-4071]|nr:carbonic anhydrase [Calothrix sp. NIES-4071]BAZ56214.1 carbonic anhydrase [Calothrix sp. NIES-4105]
MSRINGFVGRRNFLRVIGASGASIATIAAGNNIAGAISSNSTSSPATAKTDTNKTAAPANKPVNPSEALKRLLDGNSQFVMQKATHPHQSMQALKELISAQHPFVSVLGCADSRVSSEILFDQGLGDIFDVRIAGNIASDAAIASLEYSTLHLGTQLILVLGHESCGAVKAALSDEVFPGRIGYLVESIKPVVTKVTSKAATNTLDDAVIANIRYQVQKLKDNSTVLTKLQSEGKLEIKGARYDLHTGQVKIIT